MLSQISTLVVHVRLLCDISVRIVRSPEATSCFLRGSVLDLLGKVNSTQQLTLIECLLVGQPSAGHQEENNEQDKGSGPVAPKSSYRMRSVSPPQLS